MQTSLRGLRRIGALVVFGSLLVASPALAQTVSVTADRVNLRAKPSTESPVLATFERGAELTVIETAGSWYKVRDRATGKEGYLHSLTVKVIAGAAGAAPAAGTAAPPQQRPPARTSPSPSAPPRADPSDDKPVTPLILAGFVSGGGTTTWALGGGVGFKPFSNPRIRLQGDLLWHREKEEGEDESINTFVFSGNAHYLFEASNMTPFAGGGLVWAKASCNGCDHASAFGFSLVGGTEFMTGNLTLRGEARLVVIQGSSLFAVLGGICF